MMKYYSAYISLYSLLNHITYVSTGEEPVRKVSEEVCN